MIYLHNPKCSKSREGLKILESEKVKFTVREYLKDPLTQQEILSLIKKLHNPIQELVRTKEDDYEKSKLQKNSTEIEIANALAKFPILLERPILISGDKAIIGRPPENLKKIF